ncbi:MAG: hypothetical protein HZC42_09235 [Candidatus Eisenbacteria bacterium]|nr:hypothetical protein [Candidatus Eisenbacteria bacterium]
MTDPTLAPRALAWLEQQLEELGSLRNAGRRAPAFKLWRQNTLTVVQRIWPNEPKRSERFRRIPFSPPTAKADERAVREHHERGCGEAAAYLRALISEVRLVGVTDSGAAAAAGPSSPSASGDPGAGRGTAATPAAAAPAARSHDPGAEDLLSRSPVFARRAPAPPPRRQAPPLSVSPAAAEFHKLAAELEALGLPAPQREPARRLFHELAGRCDGGGPSWELVQEALRVASASPALARRALPLLLPFIEAAA